MNLFLNGRDTAAFLPAIACFETTIESSSATMISSILHVKESDKLWNDLKQIKKVNYQSHQMKIEMSEQCLFWLF